MSDLALQWQDGRADLVFADGDLVTDDSLLTAVLISLGTDRLAAPADTIPDGSDDRRGWWADYLDSSLIGSRFWLLARSKNTPETLAAARDYDIEALQWLIDDGAWSAVEVLVSASGRETLQHRVIPTYPNGQTGEAITLTVPRVTL